MRSRDLRHSIELQARTDVADGMGGVTSSWATQGSAIRAAIWPVSVSEQRKAAAPTAIGTHQIRIRYYAGISEAWRVKFGSRFFSIVGIVDKEEKRVQMDLLCREVMA